MNSSDLARVIETVGKDRGIKREILCSTSLDQSKETLIRNMHAFNEITIERGTFSYLTNLELFVNEKYLTCIQADGVIFSTSSGSTAYNLSAGGSIVHQDVSAVLVTPICPHSLSFRPIILPANADLSIRMSEDSRADYVIVSLDGDNKFKLY